ncbi:acyl-ACP--UDP-N-acetylglucosamine O-acyltransferase [Fibrobacterota bacterium]
MTNTPVNIHHTALVHPESKVAADVSIGPYSVIDKEVVLSSGVVIGCHCHLFSGVSLEGGVKVYDGAVLGSDPQDLKYKGEKSLVTIGESTCLREYVTVNTGTAARGETEIGKRCMIMAYSHVAHDCVIGDEVIIANGVQMGGHVNIGKGTVISGMTGIHQFTSIGAGSFVGGGLRVARDILPFTKALGEPLTWAGINDVGLKKLGLPDDARNMLKKCYKCLQTQGNSALEAYLESERFNTAGAAELVSEIKEFMRISKRGLLR